MLVWESEAGATDDSLATAWCRVNFTVETERQKEGTMTFSNVPTSGRVSFIFGEGGYSHLIMTLGPEDDSEAKA